MHVPVFSTGSDTMGQTAIETESVDPTSDSRDPGTDRRATRPTHDVAAARQESSLAAS
jgi:hypothetical protein